MSEPCSSIWLLVCEWEQGLLLLFPSSWLLRVMVEQHRGCDITLGCCLLAGTWMVGAHRHRVPARWGSLGKATHHPLTLMSTWGPARSQQGMAEHLGVPG